MTNANYDIYHFGARLLLLSRCETAYDPVDTPVVNIPCGKEGVGVFASPVCLVGHLVIVVAVVLVVVVVAVVIGRSVMISHPIVYCLSCLPPDRSTGTCCAAPLSTAPAPAVVLVLNPFHQLLVSNYCIGCPVHHGPPTTQVLTGPLWQSSTKNTNYGYLVPLYYWCSEQGRLGFSFCCDLSPGIKSSLSSESSWISSLCPLLAGTWGWCWDNWIRLARASGLHVRLYCWCWSSPLWLLKLFRRQYPQIRLLMIFGKLVDSCLWCRR